LFLFLLLFFLLAMFVCLFVSFSASKGRYLWVFEEGNA
jgi:hypothetical protein